MWRGERLFDTLEAGLIAADPSYNTRRLNPLRSGKLIVGDKGFEPHDSPKTGDEVYFSDRMSKSLQSFVACFLSKFADFST